MTIRRYIIRLMEYILDKLGLFIIAKWRMKDYFLTKRLQKIILKYQIDCIVDVGANIGQYATYLRKQVGYKNFNYFI